ncbi:hypothetical protein [Amphibacillus cookii]|uniref:hypothetical protein n=1 Tax=Amphibacillus cookii TaxID=767787 RepID=UPI00195D9F59|nr:hypothetical protein [Amphibacillus cookii]MBM7543295.1 hypothetical protein [Amphibacillus cookii]
MKCENIFLEKLDSVIQKYKLKYIDVSKDSAFLIGNEFVLILTIHFDHMYVEYVYRDSNDNLISYNITSYIVSKFDSKDRENIGNPQNVSETLIAIFTIWSKGLPRHWSQLLSGDKDWLKSYNQFELSSKPKKVIPEYESILKKYI